MALSARTTAVAVLSGALVVAAASASVTSAAGSANRAGPGCNTHSRVIVHNGLGRRLAVDEHRTVCAMQTGYQTSETRIATGNDGTVVQFPALLPMEPAANTTGKAASGFAVSRDRGQTWHVYQVKLPIAGTAHPSWTSQDVNVFTDRTTGRIFASAPELFEAQPNLAYSDDGGQSWVTSRPLAGYSVENPNFIFAPPRTSRLSGYPNVVYYCENLTPFGTSARFCSKSLDGGNSWISIEHQGLTGRNGVPAHPECGSSREEFSPGPEGYPVAAPDGSLYLIVSCGGKHFVARSTDEASTWPIVKGPSGQPLVVRHLAGRAAPVLRADVRGNLYVISQVGARLLLSSSRDRGLTWSRERNLVPPGVTGLDKWYVAAREPGHVAVSFYAAHSGQGGAGGLDAWLSETRSALSHSPRFTSARVSDGRTPALWSSSGNAPWPLLDFIGVDIGPNGDVWGSFIQDCGPTPGDGIACRGRPTYDNVGLIGRITTAR